jgi:hypothetical protein
VAHADVPSCNGPPPTLRRSTTSPVLRGPGCP